MDSTPTQQVADQVDFLAAVLGKRIVNAELVTPDYPVPGEICILRLELEDGSSIRFDGSGQIGIDTVWAALEPVKAESGNA